MRDTGPDRGLGLAYAAGWLVVASIYAGLYSASGAGPGMAVRGAAAVALPNALLGRLSLRLARRWPWPEGPRPSGVARGVLAAAGLAAAATAGWLLLVGADARFSLGSLRLPPVPIMLWQSVINSLIQLTLLGAGHAWQNGVRAQRAESLRARAELQLLRTQLNPHFVLNTLHALLGLVRREPSDAEAAIERLGELLRFGMSVEQRRSDRVAFREEWEFVKSYLDLERLRLGDRLRLELSADPAAMEVPVPPFALQPLVENAIVHAVAPRGSGGQLRVLARREGGLLRIEVRDDGPGAAEADILASPRLGLRLLRERLAALYAGQARLRFDAAEEGGLRVRLDVPEGGFPDAA